MRNDFGHKACKKVLSCTYAAFSNLEDLYFLPHRFFLFINGLKEHSYFHASAKIRYYA